MNVVFPWISSPYGSLGLAHHRYAYCLWELSDANTQTLSGPLALIRSLWCLEGQMVVVAIRAPGLTPAGWLALGYEALPVWNSYCKDVAVSRLSYIYDGNPYLEGPSLYWDGAQGWPSLFLLLIRHWHFNGYVADLWNSQLASLKEQKAVCPIFSLTTRIKLSIHMHLHMYTWCFLRYN